MTSISYGLCEFSRWPADEILCCILNRCCCCCWFPCMTASSARFPCSTFFGVFFHVCPSFILKFVTITHKAVAQSCRLCFVHFILESLTTVPHHTIHSATLTTKAIVTLPCDFSFFFFFLNNGAVAVTSLVSGVLAGGWQAAGERSV